MQRLEVIIGLDKEGKTMELVGRYLDSLIPDEDYPECKLQSHLVVRKEKDYDYAVNEAIQTYGGEAKGNIVLIENEEELIRYMDDELHLSDAVFYIDDFISNYLGSRFSLPGIANIISRYPNNNTGYSCDVVGTLRNIKEAI